MTFALGQRGTALFSPERLTQVLQETVLPEVDAQHSLVLVASLTDGGARAGLVFRKTTLYGEWRLEAAFEHSFGSGENLTAARIVFKL